MFTIGLASGDQPTDTYTFTAFTDFGLPFPNQTFDIVDQTNQMGSGQTIDTPLGGSVQEDDGALAFAPVAAPEPSSVALMLLGVGLVFVMRKRIGQGLPQAS
jgi:hypothetical protein